MPWAALLGAQGLWRGVGINLAVWLMVQTTLVLTAFLCAGARVVDGPILFVLQFSVIAGAVLASVGTRRLSTGLIFGWALACWCAGALLWRVPMPQPAAILLGLGLGAATVLSWAAVNRSVALLSAQTGQRAEARAFAGLTVLRDMVSAFVPLVIGLMLDEHSELAATSGLLTAAAFRHRAGADRAPRPPEHVAAGAMTQGIMTRAAAFFDVDGTICATRSTDSLIWHRARQHPAWRHRLWLASLVWRAPMLWLVDKVSRGMTDRLVYAQFAGLSEARLHADADLCCDTLLQPSCFADAFAEIAMHRAAGRRIVLVSGGTDRVLAPLAARLGADLVAQRLEVRNGRFNGAYRSYEGLAGGDVPASKARARRRPCAITPPATASWPPQSYAYGDSVNDIAMLSEVGHAVAVNPDRRLRREAIQRGWPRPDLEFILMLATIVGSIVLLLALTAIGLWLNRIWAVLTIVVVAGAVIATHFADADNQLFSWIKLGSLVPVAILVALLHDLPARYWRR